MLIDLDTIVRASVPPAVNGQVWLDRGTSQAFAMSAEFRAALSEFAPGSLRGPTTGHDNLPRSHPMAPKHTYKFGDFHVPVKGNLWHPDWNTPGYTDEDGNPGDGKGLQSAGPVSEIIGIQAYCDTVDWLNGQGGAPQRVHYFLDWQSGWSEGVLRDDPSSATPGPYADADLKWFRDPYAVDIDGNAIPPATLATMTSLEFKILENNRAIKYLAGRGYSNVILNLGGEDWRGFPGANGNGPWGPDAGTDQDDKYHWLTDHRAPVLQGCADFIAAQGYTGFEFCVGFLESVEGGRQFPLGTSQRDRNRNHLAYEVSQNGLNFQWLASSNHYRGDWHRWLTEDQMAADGSSGMQYTFITDSGQGSWEECRQWVFDTHGKKWLGMANSVGDAATSLTWTTAVSYNVGDVVLYTIDGKYYVCLIAHMAGVFALDLGANKWALTEGAGSSDDVSLPNWQRGLVGAQQLIEQMTSGMDVAQMYLGFMGEYKNAGANPSEGLTGKSGSEFTKFELYHALKTFGPILAKGATLMSATVTETGLIQCVLRFTRNGRTVYAVWLLNKKFTGSAPNEVGAAQTVTVSIPRAKELSVGNVRRYSQTETTNPFVSGIVSASGTTITADLAAFSLTYFEIETPGITLSPERLFPVGHGRWEYVNTDPIDTCITPGFWDPAYSRLTIGDLVDVIQLDYTDARRSTVIGSTPLTVTGRSAGVVTIAQGIGLADVGSTPGIPGVTCALERWGPFFRLTFTLRAVSIPVTDAGGSGASGSLKLFDFVQGSLLPLGARQNYTAFAEGASLTGGAGDAAFVMGLGSVAADAGDGALTGTEVDIGDATGTITLSGGTGAGTKHSGAKSPIDGTGTAVDLYLNWCGSAASIDANSSISVTGTITVLLAMMGDD